MNNPLRKPFRYTYSSLSFILIGLNLAVYMLNMLVPNTMYYMAMIPSFVLNGYIWQFVTYMFVHSGISHIAFNMLALFFFGQAVERQMGSREFLLFYLVTGTLAGIFSFIVYFLTGSNVVLLGASGAVYAVLLAYAVYFPDSRIFIFGIVPIKARSLVLIYTAIELLSQFGSFRSGISHLTHLAGFGFAFLYFIIRLGVNPIDSLTGRRGNPWN
ncbi:MAG: rhomboid family intramembrane serine protease [Spirochaetales bacterium]|uniref:Rhomboid family intramembrane serine protease n=1 Tax=Candidatus Thalassospirochaeta sargassi TaxID=3119039 RepID=A0AAJ1MJY8_9SPIO|nr:rhomboid family intramembrane serine protease [Spirochaetales bacterium]